MQLRGLQDALPFLNYLDEKSIWYRLEHERPGALMVSIHLPGIRLEVEFFDDHIEYSLFEGDESVDRDQARLFAMLEDDSK